MEELFNTRLGSLAMLMLMVGMAYLPWPGFPFAFMLITFPILSLCWSYYKTLRPLGFVRFGMAEAAIAVILFSVVELAMDFAIQPAITWLLPEPADYSAFASLEGDGAKLGRYLLYMWISAALGEELLFRGFVFLQLKKIYGDRPLVTILISAVLFALPHAYQGASGLLVTFVFGLIFGAIYARFKNLWINILVHGLVDTMFLVLAYFGMLSYYS